MKPESSSFNLQILLFLSLLFLFRQHFLQNFDLQNEGQSQGVEKHDLRHSVRNRGDFFRMFATWKHTFTHIVTHLHTHALTHTQREIGVITIGKIYKAPLPINNNATARKLFIRGCIFYKLQKLRNDSIRKRFRQIFAWPYLLASYSRICVAVCLQNYWTEPRLRNPK